MKQLSDKDYKMMTRILEAVKDRSISDGSNRSITLRSNAHSLLRKWKENGKNIK